MPPKTEFFINPKDFPKGLSLIDFETSWNILFTDNRLNNPRANFKEIKCPMIYYTKSILNNPNIQFS